MTPQQIFNNHQILNVKDIPSLVGKTIAITNPEYRWNNEEVRLLKVTGLSTDTRGRIKLEGEMIQGLKPWATNDDSNCCLPAGAFYGSDADRAIFYVVIPD